MKSILNEYNLEVSRKYHASFKDIKKAIDDKFPILTSAINDTHWIVIYGYSTEDNKISHLYILDPSLKRLRAKWPIEKFKDRWKKEDGKRAMKWIAVVMDKDI